MEIDFLSRMTHALGKIQVAHPGKVIVGVVVFTFLIFPGLGLLYTDTSNENFLPENDPVVESLFIVGTDFQGSSFTTLQILFFVDPEQEGVISDLREGAFLRQADLLAASLGKLEYVDGLSTPMDIVKQHNNGIIPDDIEEIKRILHSDPRSDGFYNEDFSIMRMTLFLGSLGATDVEQQQKYNEILYHIETVSFPDGVTATAWGDVVQFIELGKNLGEGLGFTGALAFLSIFILVVLYFRSVISGILGVVPIAISLIWTMGTMGYINLPFTIITSGFIPIVMGFGIDFSIHLMNSIKHLQSEGKKIEEAILQTMEEIGEAIFASTITTMIGFLSLLLASLLVTQRLGMTLALSVFYVFLGCIVMVPPVLLLQERIFKGRGIKEYFKERFL